MLTEAYLEPSQTSTMELFLQKQITTCNCQLFFGSSEMVPLNTFIS